MKKVAVLSVFCLFFIAYSCNNEKKPSNESESNSVEAIKSENLQSSENNEKTETADLVNADQPQEVKKEETQESSEKAETSENPSYDPNRGEGKFSNVKIGKKLNSKFAEAGSEVYDSKCASCHKLTDEKLVGPGWAGVTKRRHPGWIMNFMTNTDVMLDKDPAAKKMLELCAVRMPNQSLSDEETRNLLEFMRKNDGVQP